MLIRLYQRNIEYPLPKIDSNASEWNFLEKMLHGSDTFIFSEYFSFHKELQNQEDYIKESNQTYEWLKNLSKKFLETLIIGGSILLPDNKSKIKNTSFVFHGGNEIAKYEKRQLFGKEINLIHPGDKNVFFKHPKDSSIWGILICADVFIPNIFNDYSHVDYIAIPTSSPYRPNDNLEEQNKRDQSIFLKGSSLSQAALLKCCSVGSVGKKALDGSEPPRLQGRSLIVDPNRIREKSPDIYWEGVMEFDIQNNKTMIYDYHR